MARHLTPDSPSTCACPAHLVVRLEGLEEVGGGVRPHALVHVHLAAALADDAHDARVRDGRLDGQRFLGWGRLEERRGLQSLP